MNKETYAQQGEDLIFLRIIWEFLRLSPSYVGTYVDIGSYHPVKDSNTYLLYRKGWSGLAVDISAASIEAHKAIRPRDIALQCAVSDLDGELVTSHQPLTGVSLHSTLYPMTIPDRFRREHVETPIQTARLDTILEDHLESRKIDLLSIDVEGSELQVINGFNLEQHRPLCIAVESHGLGVLDSINSPWIAKIVAEGYTLVASTGVTHFLIPNEFLRNKQTINPK